MAEKADYDADNIFAKILSKEVPCHKVYESGVALAFLDLFPMAEGHTVVIPKQTGYQDMLAMPSDKAARLLGEVHKVARAVKAAFDGDGVTIFMNNGASAGQTVFHPHWHVVPRKEGDGLKFADVSRSGKADLSEEAAVEQVQKLSAELLPKKVPVQLVKPKWQVVSDINPDFSSMNLQLKVIGDVKEVEVPGIPGKKATFWEVLCGDRTGTVVVSLREHQKDVAVKDGVLALRNASPKMVETRDAEGDKDKERSGYTCIRIAVDKWGKVEKSEEEFEGEVNLAEDKNVSAQEFERVDTAEDGDGKGKGKKGKGKGKGKHKGKGWK